MATSSEIDVDTAVEEVLQTSLQDEDPLECLTNTQIAELYSRLTPEDQRLFLQFKAFHRQYYNQHGETMPSYQLARGIVRQIFSGLPTRDAETIARAREELLAVERLKALCKKLGLKVPREAIEKVVREEPRPEAGPLQFPSIQQLEAEASARAEASAQAEVEVPTEAEKRPLEEEEAEVDTKPDVKPSLKRMATQKHGERGLLKRFVGQIDDEVFLTHVKPGTDPYQQYDEDDPAEMIELEVSTDEEIEDADDLSEVSLMSQGDVTPAELKTLLAGISTAHKQVAEAVDLLQERVQGMTLEQVDDTVVAVSSEVANVRGLAFMTSVFDQEEMALALAVGTRRLQEWQVLMEKRQKNDITPYARLQEIFGHNARTISECAEGKKYRYTRSSVSKPQATKTVVRYLHTEYLGKPKGDEEETGTSAETTQ